MSDGISISSAAMSFLLFSWSISTTSWSTDTTGYFGGPSFGTSPLGGALTGGVNDTTDAGTVWANVGGVQASVNFGSGSTASNIATALASAINGNSSMPVTASASSGTINLTEKTQGSNPALSVGSTTNYSNLFAQPSFTATTFSTVLNVSNAAQPMSILTSAVTLYTYDTLDNLTCVEQHGNVSGTGCSSASSNDASSSWRIRRFTYNSLSQLLTAKNPESGTITYTYDADGNLLTKTDARNVVTTMTYDQLHRVITKTYSDSTPSATYTYDVSSADGHSSLGNPIGRLVEVQNSNARTVNSFDARGRVASQWQCTPVNCPNSWYSLTYLYNYHDEMTQETTPMGFTVNQTYDAAARLLNLTSSWSDPSHPAALMSVDATTGYTPFGAIQKFTYGNGLIELNAYNSRLQPTGMRTYNPANGNADVLNLTYGFTDSAGHNSGNVMQFTSTATQLFMRSYTGVYPERSRRDELNRLATMSSPADASGCNGLKWTYDPWANRLNQTVTSGACLSGGHPSGATNRISDTGYGYDVSGNMTQGPDPNSLGTLYYAFDAENRMTSVNSGSVGTYSYDASGNRVRRVASGVTTDYVYDASGSVVAEWSGGVWSKGYVYSGAGQLVAQYNGAYGVSGATTVFVHKDHLGSTRILTTYSTTQNQNAQVSDNMDYLPYGELLSGSSSTTHKFTGKERDAESGLDNFGARYLGTSQGRFASADPMMNSAQPNNPQTWNRYSYALNNPLFYTDPTGLWAWSAALGGDVSNKDLKKQQNAAKKNKNKEEAKRIGTILSRRDNFRNALNQARNAAENLVGSERAAADRALGQYGKDDGKGTIVALSTDPSNQGGGFTVADHNNVVTAFGAEAFQSSIFFTEVAHEGDHAAHASSYISSGVNQSIYDAEFEAHQVSAWIAKGAGVGLLVDGVELWNPSWKTTDRVNSAVDKILAKRNESSGSTIGKLPTWPGGNPGWK